MKKIAILCVVIAFFLEVCSIPVLPESQTTDQTAQSTPSPPAASLTPAGQPETTEVPKTGLPGGAAIVYQRDGGFAGLHETWTFYSDGRLVSADGKEWRVDPQKIAALLALLESKGFFELEEGTIGINTCCDRFVYTFQATSGGKTHRVTFVEGDPAVPQALLEIQTAVSDLVSAATGLKLHPW